MKNLFPGHFSKPTSEFNELWRECIFVFDTNILLNLYRYSDETTNEFTSILLSLKDRVWIPHRVADEYLCNRLKVISEQREEYDSAISEISKLESRLENSRQHPFISQAEMKGAKETFKNLTSELNKNKSVHENRLTNDDIKDKIAEIFDNRVGEAPSTENLISIIKEGEKRYSEKIPPGYSDAKKATTDDTIKSQTRPYGDLIVWKQILEKSKSEGKPIIFVTDDGKEDWWLRFKGKTIGPRPELIEEFESFSGKSFHMYHPEQFLFQANENLKKKTSTEIIDEIVENRLKETPHKNQEFDAIKLAHRDSISQERELYTREVQFLLDSISSITDELNEVYAAESELRFSEKHLKLKSFLDKEELNSEKYINCKNSLDSAMLARQELEKRRADLMIQHSTLLLRIDDIDKQIKICNQ